MKIGHMIPREPSFEAWGDSSLDAGGGFSPDLLFWWFVAWPDNVRSCTLMFRPNDEPTSKEFVSINALEFVVIILNYAASKLAILEEPETYNSPAPILLNYADNTSAISWTKRAARSSPMGKALGLILCSLLINSPLALHSEHVAGVNNVLADKISRSPLHDSNTCPCFDALTQEFPILISCRRYIPSPELLSEIYQALSLGCALDPINRLPLGHFAPDRPTG